MNQSNATLWNKASSNMPKESFFCWCYIPMLQKRGGVNLGFWQDGRFCDLFGYVWGKQETVTHYRPIEVPEPPMHEALTVAMNVIDEKIKAKRKRQYAKEKELVDEKAKVSDTAPALVKKTRLKRIKNKESVHGKLTALFGLEK